jgi:hypothetical protein
MTDWHGKVLQNISGQLSGENCSETILKPLSGSCIYIN